MDFALQPQTTAGARFVALADQHAADFAIRADQHDREGSFPFENIEAMQRSGVMAACVPVESGGMGVESLHDAMLGINRLGRGDGSTAIAAAMHLFASWMLTRAWRAATVAGETPQAERAASVLRQIGTGQVVRCSPQSEPGTDMLHPLVEATKVEEGWHLNGRKIFGTLSPAASLLAISCRARDRRAASVGPSPPWRLGVRAWTSRITGTRLACGRPGATILCSRTALSRRRPSWRTARGGNGRSGFCQARWPSSGKAQPDQRGGRRRQLHRYFVISMNSSSGPRASRGSGPTVSSRQWSM
jgi:Acyl-CoA dehydrogenase, N-terminal domain